MLFCPFVMRERGHCIIDTVCASVCKPEGVDVFIPVQYDRKTYSGDVQWRVIACKYGRLLYQLCECRSQSIALLKLMFKYLSRGE